jgi:hypothetical protein
VLTEIATLDLITGPSVLESATVAIDALRDAGARAVLLAKLLSVCQGAELDALLVRYLSILQKVDDTRLLTLAPMVVPYLTSSRWPDYLARVETVHDPLLRLRILAGSAKMLEDPHNSKNL